MTKLSFMTFRSTSSDANIRNEKVEKEFLSRRWSAFLGAAIVVLFVAVRLWRLTASCLWFDEIFSIHATRHGWTELLRFVAADIIHPPLFYLLLKVWIAIGGESLIWLRLFPALVSMATIVPFPLLCRELGLRRHERNLALLLLAVNGYLIKYAQELRMYSLLMFISVCSLWLLMKVFRLEQTTRKQFVWLFLVNLLLVYSHYAGWLVVVLEASALLIWRRREAKRFLIAVAITMLAYAPWVYLVTRNAEAGKGLAQNIGWVMRPTFRDITQFYALLNKPFWFVQSSAARPYDLLTAIFALLLFGAPLLMWSVRLWRPGGQANDRGVQAFRALYLFALAPATIVFALSWLLPQSSWGTRHFIIAAGPYSILVAVAIARLRRVWARIAISLVLGSWFLLAGSAWVLASPPVYIWCAWEPLARQVVTSEPPPTAEVRVYAFEDLVAYHLWFAFDSPEFQVFVIKNLEGIQEDPAYFLPRRFNEIALQNIAQINGNEIWIAYRAARWDETLPPLNTLETMGYTVRNIYSSSAQGQRAFMVRMTRKE
ncbi:MAG: glycosyltransferase family 39 protein [bacterium]